MIKKGLSEEVTFKLDLQDKEFTGRERGWKAFQAEARGFVISFYSTYDLFRCLHN